MYKLYGRPGSGNVAVEALLAECGAAHQVITVERDAQNRLSDNYARINPMRQVPGLVLPDGTVMTESAAITLHLADASGRDDFVPAPNEPVRAPFLRWLVYLVANIYPTFTYGDIPERFVTHSPEAASAFRATLDAHAQRLWQVMEAAAGAPWFLGPRFSALDIYLAVMTQWRPRRAWFAEHAPRLHAAAVAAQQRPELAAVMQRNFPRAG